MARIPSYAGRRTIFGAPRGWFFSKLDVASLHVILALRAARRAVFPVARCEIDGLSIAIRVSTPNEYRRADTYATKEPRDNRVAAREPPRRRRLLRRRRQHRPLLALCCQAPSRLPCLRPRAGEPELWEALRNLLLDRVANVAPCFFPLSKDEAFAPFYVHRTAQAAISQLHFHALDTPAHLKHMQVSEFRIED